MTIDWTLPLETNEPKPRKVTINRLATPRLVTVTNSPGHLVSCAVDHDGKIVNGPAIRNVRAPRTSDEALRRMEALVRRMAGADDVGDMTREAREIRALIEPDPDITDAYEVLEDILGYGATENDAYMQIALAALKRGIALGKAKA